MLIRARLSATLDGFVATPGGSPTPDVDSRSHAPHDDDLFNDSCGAIVWGRTGFDQGFGSGWEVWPWPDKKVFVLTSKPLSDQATDIGIVAADGPEDLISKLRTSNAAGEFNGDAHIAGGGRTVRLLLAAGAIDRLQLIVLPILVGTGVPLFNVNPVEYSTDAWRAADRQRTQPAAGPFGPLTQFELDGVRTLPDGVIEITYAPTVRPELAR